MADRKQASDVTPIDALALGSEWTVSRRGYRGCDGYMECLEHRRVVGRLELLVEYDPNAEDGDVYWHVFCEGNGIMLGKVGTRSRGPIAFLMDRGRREAEIAVGIDRGALPNVIESTPLRLHPDDIAAIVAGVLAEIGGRRG